MASTKRTALQRNFTPDFLFQRLAELTESRRFCVAFSGGLDSQVLLHAMASVRVTHPEIQLRAVHVHHGVSPDADTWVEHCRKICAELNVEYVTRKITWAGKSTVDEAALRAARYQAFTEILQPGETLLTAHTENDQAETLLLQLIRGAGVAGLAAMPKAAAFAQGWHVRPLLEITRQALTVYAHARKLHWIEDASNQNLRFARNFLRRQIVPLLTQRWPSVTRTLARSAQHCAEAAALLSEIAMQDLQETQADAKHILLISRLIRLSLPRQHNVLRYWLKNLNLPLPDTAKLQQIMPMMVQSREDARPLLRWEGAELRRYQDKLYALPPLPAHDPHLILTWSGTESLLLPDGRALSPEILAGISCAPAQLTVRFRQGGERCRLVGRKGRHSLKKLMQEWGVPPWERKRVPLIFADEQLLVVIGYCVCEREPTCKNGL